MLEGRGHRFVRYADDCNTCLKGRRAAGRVMGNCVRFLEGESMRLKVNREKSEVGSPAKLKFLGFALHARIDRAKGVRIHPKSVKRFKDRIRGITKRNRGVKFDRVVRELRQYTEGWIQYYGIADMKKLMESMNQWTRRRLRMYIWKQWKKVSARFTNLQKLGATRQKAWEWANTRKACWHTSNSWILSTTVTNQRPGQRGYMDISKRHGQVHSRY
jgi:hypothetical protein